MPRVETEGKQQAFAWLSLNLEVIRITYNLKLVHLASCWANITGGLPRVSAAGGCRAGRPGPLEQQYFGGVCATADQAKETRSLSFHMMCLSPFKIFNAAHTFASSYASQKS